MKDLGSNVLGSDGLGGDPLGGTLPGGTVSRALDGQHLSPVEVIINIRKELAEFQRNGGKWALRVKLRKACKEALLQVVSQASDTRTDDDIVGPTVA
jgi:hypothetical protein